MFQITRLRAPLAIEIKGQGDSVLTWNRLGRYVLFTKMWFPCLVLLCLSVCDVVSSSDSADEEVKKICREMPIDFYVMKQDFDVVTEKVVRDITIRVGNPDPLSNFTSCDLTVNASSSETDNLVINGNGSRTAHLENENSTLVFQIRGEFIGYSEVIMDLQLLCQDEDVVYSCQHKQRVGVVRAAQHWMVAFTFIMMGMVIINYINMGVQLDLKVVLNTLKRPVGPVIGFVSQFTVMPLASYAYGLLFLSEDPLMRLGLFSLGCSPGGSSSNFWTLMFKGDINLSITMTFISVVCALFMMPLWLYTLGKQLTGDSKVTIPFGDLAMTLTTMTLPLFVGIFIKYKLPRVAAFSRKIIRPMTVLIVLVGMTIGNITNYYIYLLFTWKIVAASFAVVLTGFALGALLAWIARLNNKQILAVSIETAFQNSSISFVVLTSVLLSPDRELVTIPVIVQMLVSQLPLWFIFLGIKLRDKCFPRDKLTLAEEESTEKGEDNEHYTMRLDEKPEKVYTISK